MENYSMNRKNDAQEYEKKLKDLYTELTNDFEKRMKSDVKRTNIFFICIFLAFVGVVGLSLFFIDGSLIAEMRNVEASTAKNTDYLELALPVLVAIVLFFIAFLGLNRLRDMDAQVEQIRNSIGLELNKEVRRLETLRDDLASRIESMLENKATTWKNRLKNKLNKSVGEIHQAGQDCLLQFQKARDQAGEMRVHFEERYGWLANMKQNPRDVFLNDVATVRDVHDELQTLWNLEEKPCNIRELTTRYVELVVAEDSTIYGDKDDYHNLAAECARHGLYELATRICEKGLVVFQNEVDLRADQVLYAVQLGRYKTAAQALKRLQAIDKSMWNWRTFEFSIDYFRSVGQYAEAEELANEFIEYQPFNERAYYAKAEVCILRYPGGDGTNKAIETLQVAMKNNLNCPMCATKLGALLAESGKLEEGLSALNRAFMEHAQELPNCSLGAIAFERARIYDRLAHKTLAETSDEDEANRLATLAARDYNFAAPLFSNNVTYCRQIRQRLLTLRNYFELNETVSEEEDMILQRLMSLALNEQSEETEGDKNAG